MEVYCRSVFLGMGWLWESKLDIHVPFLDYPPGSSDSTEIPRWEQQTCFQSIHGTGIVAASLTPR